MAFLLYLAGLALVGAVAAFVSIPLFSRSQVRAVGAGADPGAARWFRQKAEALSAIREAEFDLQMGKLSEEDYRLLRGRYESRALEAIARLEEIQGGAAGAPGAIP